jgi:thymidylate synthase (FAD)
MLQGGSPTDARKQVNQAARAGLPNETEAPIVVTANVRGWRHFCEQRANPHADAQIRELAVKVLFCLKVVAPLLFSDCQIEKTSDGTLVATTEYRKI